MASTTISRTTSWLPVTTAFSAPAACSSLIWGAHAPWLAVNDPGYGLSVDPNLTCLPPAATTWWQQNDTSIDYSIGPTIVCPQAYTTATTSVQDSSTFVACCPSNYRLNVVADHGAAVQCQSFIEEGDVVTIVDYRTFTSNNLLASAWVTAVSTATDAVVVEGIQMNGWIFDASTTHSNSASATDTARPESPIDPSAVPTSSTPSQASPTSGISETPLEEKPQAATLSIGAKIGIAVGGTLVFAAIIGFIIFYCLRRRKAERAKKEKENRFIPYAMSGTEQSPQGVVSRPRNVYSQAGFGPTEVGDGAYYHHELETNMKAGAVQSCIYELPSGRVTAGRAWGADPRTPQTPHPAGRFAAKTSSTTTMPLVDALIIGAGPAGLSAALALARQLHTAIVFDSSLFRNARSAHMHTIPTWDHKDPAAFRGATRVEILERYNTISFEDRPIAKIEKTTGGDFTATAADGTSFTGRRVVLATGVTDLPLDIKGYDDCWGRSIYHCLFCHGFEDAGKPSSGILALGDNSAPATAVALARSAMRLTTKVVIYTSNNPTVQSSIAELLGDNDAAITIDDREVTALALGAEGNGITLTFADGSTAPEAFLAHKPATKINGPFAQQLGLELSPAGDIITTPPFGATSVKGVYAAGDCATPMKAVMQALYMGTFSGVGIAHDLQAEGPKL
ncbi:hypothetical protein V493_06556 [Pseudogymnoascus sp. VKM F-4281 (FW-2241)]|nr:hypothetical protein V493_06556 [Pseudogymnoascus sp. VKM F-4281 (FW-2241)]